MVCPSWPISVFENWVLVLISVQWSSKNWSGRSSTFVIAFHNFEKPSNEPGDLFKTEKVSRTYNSYGYQAPTDVFQRPYYGTLSLVESWNLVNRPQVNFRTFSFANHLIIFLKIRFNDFQFIPTWNFQAFRSWESYLIRNGFKIGPESKLIWLGQIFFERNPPVGLI